MVSFFSNERHEDLLTLTTYCRVDYLDLLVHKSGSLNLERNIRVFH